MAVRTNLTQTCDRCLKPFNEKHLKAGQEVPTMKQKGLVVCETSMTNKDSEPQTKVLFNFDDTCPDCQKAIKPLLDKLRLEGGKKKRGRKKGSTAAKSSAKKDAPAASKSNGKSGESGESNGKSGESKPQVPDYSEEAEQKAEGSEEKTQAQPERELIEDPETGDKYDAKTGEIVEQRVRDGEGDDDSGSDDEPEASGETQSGGEASGDEGHPF